MLPAFRKNDPYRNNTGDTATLRDAGGHLLDRCTFKGTSQGYVFC